MGNNLRIENIDCNSWPVMTLNPVAENSRTPLFTAPHILRVACKHYFEYSIKLWYISLYIASPIKNEDSRASRNTALVLRPAPWELWLDAVIVENQALINIRKQWTFWKETNLNVIHIFLGRAQSAYKALLERCLNLCGVFLWVMLYLLCCSAV